MELSNVLHMKGGNGETSYAKNSKLQREFITLTNQMKEEAVRKVCKLINPEEGKRVVIADFGCSSGPNSLLASKGLVSIFDKVRREEDHLREWVPEFQVFLNDLPGNDFNSIFKELAGFQEKLKEELGSGFGLCFVNGVPGSYFTRLFPSQAIHFVHSSSSLQWLSQVPKGVERSKGRSDRSVEEAFYEQFETDFSTFLKCRGEEVVAGGSMVLAMVGRKTDAPPNLSCFGYLPCLLQVLWQMTSEGLIEEEKMDTFNLPLYAPSIAEIESVVKKEGSFYINDYELFEADVKYIDKGEEKHECKELVIRSIVGHVRSALEPLLCNHFGQGLSIDELVQRFEGMVRDRMNTERMIQRNADVIAISLTKC